MIHGIDIRTWLIAVAGIVIGAVVFLVAPDLRAEAGAATSLIVALLLLKHLGLLIAVGSPLLAMTRRIRHHFRGDK